VATSGQGYGIPARYIVRTLSVLDGLVGHVEGDVAYVVNDGVRYIHDDTQTLFPLHWRKIEDD
jgi:hypothetical protein